MFWLRILTEKIIVLLQLVSSKTIPAYTQPGPKFSRGPTRKEVCAQFYRLVQGSSFCFPLP